MDLLRPAVPISGLLLRPSSTQGADKRVSAEAQSAWLLLTNSWHEHFLLEVAGADDPKQAQHFSAGLHRQTHARADTMDRHLARWALQTHPLTDADAYQLQSLQPKRGHRVGVLPHRIDVRLDDDSISYADASGQMHRTPATTLSLAHRAPHWKLFLANASRRLGVAIGLADAVTDATAQASMDRPIHLRHDLCAIVHPVAAPGTALAQITIDVRAGNQTFYDPLSEPGELSALLRTVNGWRKQDAGRYPITLTDLAVPRIERWRLHHLLMLKYEIERELNVSPESLVRH